MTTETTRRKPTAAARPRPATGAPGVKLLVTLGTVSATVFGWLTLTEQGRISQKEIPPVAPVVVDSSAAVRELAAGLQPIPPLVPQPAIDVAGIVNAQPAGGVVQSAPAVVVQAPPALRVVNPPPAAPVTTTQSSR